MGYTMLSSLVECGSTLTTDAVKDQLGSCNGMYLEELQKELESIGKPDGEPGSKERREYFVRRVDDMKDSGGNDSNNIFDGIGGIGIGPDLLLGGGKGKGLGKGGYGSSGDS